MDTIATLASLVPQSPGHLEDFRECCKLPCHMSLSCQYSVPTSHCVQFPTSSPSFMYVLPVLSCPMSVLLTPPSRVPS